MPHQVLAPVLSVVEIAPAHFVLTCVAPQMAREARPGSFVNARVTDAGYEPLLRRPFSVFTADPDSGEVSILFSVYGPTTQGLARLRSEDTVDLVGPLGGHLFRADTRPDALHVCVGGGYGVPPLVFLCKQLQQENPQASLCFVVGARTQDLLLCRAELAAAGVNVRTATDDGSHGVRGRVTDALLPILAARAARPVAVYCCGPTPMMRAVGELCATHGVACQVSLEVPMPCGVGVCMGCVVDLTDGRRVRACTDGPVFDANAVVW